MSEYLHGAYARILEVGSKVASKSQSAIVYVGTAPVHTGCRRRGQREQTDRPSTASPKRAGCLAIPTNGATTRFAKR